MSIRPPPIISDVIEPIKDPKSKWHIVSDIWGKWFHEFRNNYNKGPFVGNSTVTGATTLDNSYGTIYCNGTFTITLPPVANALGKAYYIKNIGVGTITVDGDGIETIDDETTQTLNSYDCMLIRNDESEWWIL